jgi:hypothetical protein
MWHAIYTQVNQGNSRLLVARNQIALWLLTLLLAITYVYSNGSCKPILNICVPRDFQWYKELFNPMSFDLCNRLLKIQKSIKTTFSKVKVHLGVSGSFPHTLLHSREHEMWLLGFTFDPHLCKPLPWSWAQGYSCDRCVHTQFGKSHLE